MEKLSHRESPRTGRPEGGGRGAQKPDGVEATPLLPPAFERLEEIAAPTLVIVGEADVPEFVELAGVVADRIPGARHLVIPRTAHLPSLERPDAFNAAVLEFVDGLE